MTTGEATPTVTPTLIRRVGEGRSPELAGLDDGRGGAGRTLLVFADPQAAEDFRSESGAYPDDEGFGVGAVDLDGLKAILWGFGYERVAVRGPILEEDTPDHLSFFDAQEVVRLLEEGLGE